MQIVIDLPKYLYDRIHDKVSNDYALNVYEEAIFYGKILPKGHGRLIDADELDKLFGEECVGDCGACMPKKKTDGHGRWYDTCLLIDNAFTIVEADTESEKVDCETTKCENCNNHGYCDYESGRK